MQLLGDPLPVVPRMAEEDVPKVRQRRPLFDAVADGVSARASAGVYTKENQLATISALRRCRIRRRCSGRPRCSPTTSRTGKGLGLLEIGGGARYLQALFDWALERVDDESTLWRFGNVVAGLCGNYDREFLDFLIVWMSPGTDQRARVVAAVLHEAQNDLIFDNPQFVHELLNLGQAIGPEATDRLSSSLYAATISGVRGTTPGEPFPEDLRLEEHTLAMLGQLSRWDPAFDLYTHLLRPPGQVLPHNDVRRKRWMQKRKNSGESQCHAADLDSVSPD